MHELLPATEKVPAPQLVQSVEELAAGLAVNVPAGQFTQLSEPAVA